MNDDKRNNECLNKKQGCLKELVEYAKALVIAIAAASVIMAFIFETVSVEGRSMKPTLADGDSLIVEKVTYYFRRPSYDDIIVFKYRANPARKYIKRIVGVEGDSIRISNNKILINGKIKEEPYIYEDRMSDFGEVIVPKDTVFVLGDNRNNSKDSRSSDIGFVKLNLIVGRTAYRIFPFDMIGRVN